MRTSSGYSGYCKVYFSLLFLAYLEVVLWTTCLCATGVAAQVSDSHSYLIRETGNLKFAECEQQTLPVIEDPRSAQLQLEEEHFYWQRLLEVNCFPTSEVIQPGLCSLRISPELTGIPAPYAGIKALS